MTTTPVLTLTYTSDIDTAAQTVFAFDGAASITAADTTGWPQDGATITVWINAEPADGDGVMVNFEPEGDGTGRLWIADPGDLSVGIDAVAIPATGLTCADGTWHFLAVTIQPMTAQAVAVGIYLDGVLAWYGAGALTSTDGIAVADSGTVVLGEGADGDIGLTGAMSQFMLWSGILTAAEVLSCMQIRPAAGSDTLIDWPLIDRSADDYTVSGGGFTTSHPALRYRSNRRLSASWTPATATSATFTLTVSSNDCVWHEPDSGLAASPATIADPQAGVTYTASVSMSDSTGTSAAGTATLVALDIGLPAPAVGLADEPPFALAWPAIDQAVSYVASVLQDGTTSVSPSGTTSATSLDVTSRIQDTAHTYRYTVAATTAAATAAASASRSNGPASAVAGSPAAPSLTLSYAPDATGAMTLSAAWPGTDGADQRYLGIALTSGSTSTAVAQTVLAGSVLSYTVSSGVSDGQTYSGQLRGLTAGNFGPWSDVATVTVHSFATPVITSTASDYNAGTVTVAWSMTAPEGVTPSYDLQLWNDDRTTMVAESDPGTSPHTFTDTATFTQGKSFQARVRAYADGSSSQWSDWATVAMQGVPQVTGVSASCTAEGDITVGWSAIDGTGLTGVAYVVTLLTTSGTSVYTADPVTTTSTTLERSDTKVEADTSYDVTVHATANGYTAGKDSTAVSVTVGDISPTPNPAQKTISDPIAIGTGAFAYENDDLVLDGVVPLVFRTCYSSQQPLASDNALYSGHTPLGDRWTHSYNSYLLVDEAGGSIYVVWGNLGVDRYSLTQVAVSLTRGMVYANAGAKLGSVLSRSGDTYTLTQPGNGSWRFDSSGRLTRIVQQNGNAVDLDYDDGLLHSVTNSDTGDRLTLSYSGSILQSVTDGTRTIRYGMSGGTLHTATNPLGHTRTFTYVSGQTAIMETIVDCTGVTIAKNSYDDGKVVFQQDARALSKDLDYGTSLSWSTGSYETTTTNICAVTDRMGFTSRYESLEGNGALIEARYQLDDDTILVRGYTYDAYANPLTATEYRGASSAYTDGMGNTTTTSYDDDGQLESRVTDLGDGRVSAMSYLYDDNGNQRTSAAYEGDESGFSVGAGNVTTKTYNDDNTLKSVQPPLGGATSYTYWSGDIHGLIDTKTDAFGNQFAMTWTNGLLDTVTDPYGNVSTYGWDTLNRQSSLTVAGPGADGKAGAVLRAQSFAYNDMNQPTSVSTWYPSAGQTEEEAFVTSLEYNDNNLLHKQTDPTGVTATYGYDVNYKRTSLTWPAFDSLTRVTRWSYDKNDFLNGTTLSASDPTVEESYDCDQLGRRTRYTDPNGNVFDYALAMTTGGAGPYPQEATTTWPLLTQGGTAYQSSSTTDPIGRVIREVGRDGSATTVAYDTAYDDGTKTWQTVVTVTRPPATDGGADTVVTIVLDAIGRLVTLTDEAGKVWSWSYTVETDSATGCKVGVSTLTDPLGNLSAEALDSLGRTAFVRQSGGTLTRTIRYDYDAIGRITAVTQSQSSTDAQGKTTVTDSNTTSYAYGYDSASACTTTTLNRPGGGGPTIRYVDGRGDRVRQDNPFGSTVTYGYAPWGSMAGFTDGRGNHFAYGPDAAGRMRTVTLPDSSVLTHELDAAGNRKSTSQDGGGTITRQFDSWNRLTQRTDADGRTVGYGYWPEDQLKTLTHPDGKAVGYQLDGLGRCHIVTDWNGRTTTYGRNAVGQVTSVDVATAGAVFAASTFTYDDAGDATGFTHRAGTWLLAQATYTLDGLGQPESAALILPTAPVRTPADRAITYETGNQIDSIDGTDQSFDGDGNYLGPTGEEAVAAYDAYGRVSAWDGTLYAYDLDGLRTGIQSGGAVSNLVYDVNGWQSPQVERGDPVRAVVSAVTARSAFGLGYWQPVTRDGDDSQSVTGLDRLIVAYDGSGAVTARHVHGDGLIGSEDASGVFAAALTDLSGHVVLRVEETGTVIAGTTYSPFGEVEGSFGDTGYVFGFNGRAAVQDDGNGLLHMRARGYAPAQFRFLQPDPLTGDPSRPQTLDRYSFAGGNPLQSTDPAGLEAIAAITVLGTVALAAAIASQAENIWRSGSDAVRRMFRRGRGHHRHHSNRGGGDRAPGNGDQETDPLLTDPEGSGGGIEMTDTASVSSEGSEGTAGETDSLLPRNSNNWRGQGKLKME